jgi:2TM domain-containing protein
MATDFNLRDLEQADSELRAEQSRRHFYIHTILYVMTNVLLVVLNLMVASAFPWAIFPVVIWGIALGTHYMVAFRWIQSDNAAWMAKAEFLATELHRANELPLKRAA